MKKQKTGSASSKGGSDKRHEILATLGLIFTIFLAVSVFYVIWKGGIFFGQSVKGTRDYGCLLWRQQNNAAPNVPCPEIIVMKEAKDNCCCKTKGGFAHDIMVGVPFPAETDMPPEELDRMLEDSLTAECFKTCEEKYRTQGMGIGRCSLYGLSYPG